MTGHDQILGVTGKYSELVKSDNFGTYQQGRNEEKIMSNSWIRNSRILSTASVIILMSGILANSSSAAVSAGSGCTKAGQTSTVAGKKFTCSLVWVVTSVAPQQAKTTTSSGKESVSQGNARKKASSYLTYSGFSRSGLIDQLVFEGFSQSEAAYGASANGL